MAINLLNIKPHKVSRDLSGYITFIYGGYKTGKTTLAAQMDGALLLAFERGYNALPGVVAQDITSWAEMRTVYRELKKPEVKAAYKAVVVDTIVVASELCKKYICQQNDIEDLGDLGYGKGWTKFKDEFNEIFRGLTQLGYAIYFIGHDKEGKDDKGNITNIRPALSNATREVIAGMSDVFGYARQSGEGQMSSLVLRDKTGFIECGCRFKYVPDVIPMNYMALVNAIAAAIDKEAAETGGAYVTDEKLAAVEVPTYDYEALMKEFQQLSGELVNKNQAYYVPRITSIIDKYLGKGKKITDSTPDQVEFIYLIVTEIKEDLMAE